MTCSRLSSVGAFALGTLEPDERDGMSAHVRECPACGEAAEDFALLPGLLDRLDRAEAAATRPEPRESGFRRLAVAAAAQRSSRLHRWAGMAVAAAVLALLALGSSIVWSPTGEQQATTVAASAGAIHAWVTLEPVSTGSRLALRLSGVPAEERCRLVAVARDGHRETAASWQATYEGTATINGTTGIPAANLASLVVESIDGRELVRMALPSTGRG